jgi:hypothetical protein
MKFRKLRSNQFSLDYAVHLSYELTINIHVISRTVSKKEYTSSTLIFFLFFFSTLFSIFLLVVLLPLPFILLLSSLFLFLFHQVFCIVNLREFSSSFYFLYLTLLFPFHQLFFILLFIFDVGKYQKNKCVLA